MSVREAAPAQRGKGSRRGWIYLIVVLGLVFLLWGAWVLDHARRTRPPSRSDWVQLTDFPDSASSPALSPDGRWLAFIRGAEASAGQIYVKSLPNGQPLQLTRDSQPKTALVFSPDGSRIAYTAQEETWTVPARGGEPQQMLANASGLTWVDARHVLFSEARRALQRTIVTSTESRSESRDLYVPSHRHGMAQRASVSPDGKWVLIAEVDNGSWQPCRLVPSDGSSPGRQVGPADAACIDAAWSPDGKWMYLNSNAGGGFHVWRLQLGAREAEQITLGPTEEEGIAMAPDGRSFITSAGIKQNFVWIHGTRGDRQVSSEGYAILSDSGSPFSPDGRKLYYLVRAGTTGTPPGGELWVTEPDTGHSERLLPGFLMTQYDISVDGKRVVFAASDSGKLGLWLASLERLFPPGQISSRAGENHPTFDRAGNVFFCATENGAKFLYRLKEDGAGREKVMPNPILDFLGISPDGRWALTDVAVSGEEAPSTALVVYPTAGGQPIRLCDTCSARWSPDEDSLYVSFHTWSSAVNFIDAPDSEKTFIVPWRANGDLPAESGFRIESAEQLASTPGVRVIHHLNVFPGPNRSGYAFTRKTVHRNLFRVPVP